MNTLSTLITSIIRNGILRTPHIIEAFYQIDRIDFVPADMREHTYEDIPLPIGHGQTISQPSTVAFMLEHLMPQSGQRILDIGTGSGWTTALLCRIVGEEGRVRGFERVKALVEMGRDNLARYSHSSNCTIEKATAALGAPGEKFDRILVSAAAEELPLTLVDQLAIGGRLVIPVQHSIEIITKVSEDDIRSESIYGFRFVPLLYND